MDRKSEIKKQLLQAAKIQNIEDILSNLPPAPSFTGPGKWLKTVKELYALKNSKK